MLRGARLAWGTTILLVFRRLTSSSKLHCNGSNVLSVVNLQLDYNTELIHQKATATETQHHACILTEKVPILVINYHGN